MMGWYGGGLGPLGWVGMGVFWLFLLGLIVWLVSWLLPGSNGETTRPAGESPLEILDGRLASGEIDLTDWQAQRAALMAPAEGSTQRSGDVS
jgi:uncharacterized membrane protein